MNVKSLHLQKGENDKINTGSFRNLVKNVPLSASLLQNT